MPKTRIEQRIFVYEKNGYSVEDNSDALGEWLKAGYTIVEMCTPGGNGTKVSIGLLLEREVEVEDIVEPATEAEVI